MLKKPFKHDTKHDTNGKIEFLELVQLDLAGFKNIVSKGEKRYHITFVDHCSRYTKVYLLWSKNEAKEMFLKYNIQVEKPTGQKIKTYSCLLYTSPSPRDGLLSRMPSSA